MADTVVEVSASNAMAGLYMTPDIWFFASYVLQERLDDSVQTIIHDKQPSTLSYATWADYVYDRYDDYVASHPDCYSGGEMLMAVAAMVATKRHIERGIDALVDVAINIHLKTTNTCVENPKHPLIIPHELETERFNLASEITQDKFRQMFVVEPWLSWMERIRSQFERTRKLISSENVDLAREIKYYANSQTAYVNSLRAKKRIKEFLKRRDYAKRAIRRAVKLHERVGTTKELRVFLKGEPLIIKGKLYDYKLVMDSDSLFKYTINRNTKIAPAHLTIYDKDRVNLCGTCLYFDDTAIIDHMLNVKLYASNEQTELEMLNALHVTSVTSAFFRDPFLPGLKGITDPVIAPLTTVYNIEMNRLELAASGEPPPNIALHGLLFPIAKSAFDEIMCLPKNYISMLDQLKDHNFWACLAGEESAVKAIESVTPAAFE